MESIVSQQILEPLELLTSKVCSNMLKEDSYYAPESQKTAELLLALDSVYQKDPEFILQLAYYARAHMNLKSISNFILAYASIRKKTTGLVNIYGPKTLKLPTDLLETINFCNLLKNYDFSSGIYNERKGDGSCKVVIPGPVKELSKSKFAHFSEYQLGKYCSEGRRKRMLLKQKRVRDQLTKDDKGDDVSVPTKWEIEKNTLSFKKLEITPGRRRFKLMKSLVNKKKHKTYAKRPIDVNLVRFNKVSMKDVVKMCKISKPQLMVKKVLGIKYPQSEEEFKKIVESEENSQFFKNFSKTSLEFDQNKVGRRFKLEIPKTWETEISKKGNKTEVWDDLINSKSIPLLATVRNLRNIVQSGLKEEAHSKVVKELTNSEAIIKSQVSPYQFYLAYRELQGLNNSNNDVQGYLDALEIALRTATINNVPRVPGKSLIFVDVSGSMGSRSSTHSILTIKEIASLLGLMINFASESAEFRIFSSPSYSTTECDLHINVDKDYILKNFDVINSESSKLGGGTDLPINTLRKITENKEQFNYIFFLSDMMIRAETRNGLEDTLKEYRDKVNPYMKFICCDLRSYGLKLANTDNPNNIYINGFSDKILSLIADQDPKTQVEKIKAVALEEIKNLNK